MGRLQRRPHHLIIRVATSVRLSGSVKLKSVAAAGIVVLLGQAVLVLDGTVQARIRRTMERSLRQIDEAIGVVRLKVKIPWDGVVGRAYDCQRPARKPVRARGNRTARARHRCDRLERVPVDEMERGAGESRARANALRIEASKSDALANSQTEVDVATFTQWVDAYARKETFLTDFYFKRFRLEFKPAVEAWIATRPLKNAKAPLTPFAMPQYKLAARAEADRLQAEAELSAAASRLDIQRASNYVLAVVLFASALFFAGMSAKLTSARLRIVLLVIGCVVFLGAAIWIGMASPVSAHRLTR